MSIPSFIVRSDVLVKKKERKNKGSAKSTPSSSSRVACSLQLIKKKKKEKKARLCRGMNVPRIEDRGLRNSKLDFHPSFARPKNSMHSFLFFTYQYIIIG